MARVVRLLLRTLAAACLVAAVGAAAFLLWTRTAAALDWAVARVAAASGGRVTIAGARGSLHGPLSFDRIEYRDADAAIVARDVRLDWAPSALLMKHVAITTLEAADVAITLLPSTTPAAPPDSLALPVAINIRRIAIGRLAIGSGEEEWTFDRVAADYRGDAKQHEVRKLALQSAYGSIDGSLMLAAQPPYAVGGTLDWRHGDGTPRITAQARLGGVLEHITAVASGNAGSTALTGSATLAPFAGSWLPEFAVAARDADLAAFDPALPRTALSGTLQGGTDDIGKLAAALAVENAAAGPWSDGRLPVASLAAHAALDGGGLRFDDLRADLGAGGRIAGAGRAGGAGSEWDVAVTGLNLRAIYRPLRPTRLNGRVKAAFADGRQTVDAALAERGIALSASAVKTNERIEVRRLEARAGKGILTGRGELQFAGARPFTASATFTRFDPSDFGDFPGASLSGEATATGRLEPGWLADARFTLQDSRFRGAALAGGGTFQASSAGVRDAAVDVRAGDNRLRANGNFGRPGDAFTLDLDAPRLAQLDPRLGGKLAANVTVRGRFDRPSIAFTAKGEALAFAKEARAASFDARGEWSDDADPRIALVAHAGRLAAGTAQLDTLQAEVSGTLSRHVITAGGSAPAADFTTRLEGGWREARGWTGRILTLANRGRYPFALLDPALLEAAPGRIVLGETGVDLLGGKVALRSFRWENRRLTSAGGFTGVPLAPVLAIAGAPLLPDATLTLRGDWSVVAAPRLNGAITIAREGGDLVLPGDPALPVGLEQLQLDVTFVEDAARAVAALAATRLGTAAIEAVITPPADAGPFAPQSALAGTARLDFSTLRLLDDWLGTAALVDGEARVRLAATGTLGTPLVTGTIEGDRVRIEIPQEGIALRDGRLRAELTDRAIVLQALSIAGPEGTLTATGTLPRRIEDGDSRIEWRAEDLRLLDRPDRRLTIAGSGSVAASRDRIQVRGDVRALSGYIEFDRRATATLGDDVVVVGQKAKPPPRKLRSTRLDLDATVDFGDRFRIVGAGLEARLAGRLRVQTAADGTLIATGRVRAVEGTYFAFGQQLTIDRGELYFDGPIDNPGLDIVAVRKNLPVEAGVELTGTVKVPRVRLTSSPPVPDGEKLAWLVTGRGLESATAADLSLLQAAAGTLVNSNESIPLTRRIARQIGLDDIQVRAGSVGSTGGTLGGQTVAFGKRLAEGIYLEFEQGLTAANNLIRLSYQLTRALSLRAEAGVVSGFGLFYRRSFD